MRKLTELESGRNVLSISPLKQAVVPMIKRRLVAMGYARPKITQLREVHPGVFQFKVLNGGCGGFYDHIGYFEFDAVNSPNFGATK
jgi:hypothetical protein